MSFGQIANSLEFIPHQITAFGHVHKYEAAFGCGVDILMAVTFLSIVLFQKQNQKNDLV